MPAPWRPASIPPELRPQRRRHGFRLDKWGRICPSGHARLARWRWVSVATAVRLAADEGIRRAVSRPEKTESCGQMDASEVRPLIAVSTSECGRLGKSPHAAGRAGQPRDGSGPQVPQGVEGAGAIRVVVPPLSPTWWSRCSTGSTDLPVRRPGPGSDRLRERRHSSTGPVWSELDVSKLALARGADARGLRSCHLPRDAGLKSPAAGSLHQHLRTSTGPR